MQNYNKKLLDELKNEEWLEELYWKNAKNGLVAYFNQITTNTLNKTIKDFVGTHYETNIVEKIKKLENTNIEYKNRKQTIEAFLDEIIKSLEDAYNKAEVDYNEKLDLYKYEINNANTEYNDFVTKLEDELKNAQTDLENKQKEIKFLTNKIQEKEYYQVEEYFSQTSLPDIKKFVDHISFLMEDRDNKLESEKDKFNANIQKYNDEIYKLEQRLIKNGLEDKTFINEKDKDKFYEWGVKFENVLDYANDEKNTIDLINSHIKQNEISINELTYNVNFYQSSNEDMYNDVKAKYKQIANLKKKAGTLKKLIKTGQEYKQITAIQKEINNLNDRIEKNKKNIAASNVKIAEFQKENTEAINTLNTYEQKIEAKFAAFESELKAEKEKAEKGGYKNRDDVNSIKAKYDLYQEYVATKKQLKNEENNYKLNVGKVQSEYNHELINTHIEIDKYFDNNKHDVEYYGADKVEPAILKPNQNVLEIIDNLAEHSLNDDRETKIKNAKTDMKNLIAFINKKKQQQELIPGLKKTCDEKVAEYSKKIEAIENTDGKALKSMYKDISVEKNQKDAFIEDFQKNIDDQFKTNENITQDSILNYIDNYQDKHKTFTLKDVVEIENKEQYINSLNSKIDSFGLDRVGIEKIDSNSKVDDVLVVDNITRKLEANKEKIFEDYVNENYFNVKNSLKKENEELKAHIYAKEKNIINAFKGKKSLISKGYSDNHLWLRGSPKYKEMEKTLNKMFKAKDSEKAKYFDTLKKQAREYLDYKKVDTYDSYKNVTKRRMQFASDIIAYVDAYKLLNIDLSKENEKVVNAKAVKKEVKVAEPQKEEIKVVEVKEVQRENIINENKQEKVIEPKVRVTPAELYKQVTDEIAKTYSTQKEKTDIVLEVIENSIKTVDKYLNEYNQIVDKEEDIYDLIVLRYNPVKALSSIPFDENYKTLIAYDFKQLFIDQESPIEQLLNAARKEEAIYNMAASNILKLIDGAKKKSKEEKPNEKIDELEKQINEKEQVIDNLKEKIKETITKMVNREKELGYNNDAVKQDQKVIDAIEQDNELNKLKEVLSNLKDDNAKNEMELVELEKEYRPLAANYTNYALSYTKNFNNLRQNEINKLMEAYTKNAIPTYYLQLRYWDLINNQYDTKNGLFSDSNKDEALINEVNNYLSNVYFNRNGKFRNENERTTFEKEYNEYKLDKNKFAAKWTEKYLDLVKKDTEHCIVQNKIVDINASPSVFYQNIIKVLNTSYNSFKNEKLFAKLMKFEVEYVEKYLDEFAKANKVNDISAGIIDLIKFKENPYKALSNIKFDIEYEVEIDLNLNKDRNLMKSSEKELEANIKKSKEKHNILTKTIRESEKKYNDIANNFITNINEIKEKMKKADDQKQFDSLTGKLTFQLNMFTIQRKQELNRLVKKYENNEIPMYYLRSRVHNIINQTQNIKISLFNDVNKDESLREEIDNYLKNTYFNQEKEFTNDNEKKAYEAEKEAYSKSKDEFITSWKDKYLTVVKNGSDKCVLKDIYQVKQDDKNFLKELNDAIGVNENFELKNKPVENNRNELIIRDLKNANEKITLKEIKEEDALQHKDEKKL